MSFIIVLHKEKINILEMKEKDGSENRNKNYRRESKRNLGTDWKITPLDGHSSRMGRRGEH